VSKYALCIGINDYPDTDSDLAGCVNDANDWASSLVTRGFIVSTLLDSRATGNAIRQGIVNTIARARAGDLVVIQFSGHGSFVPDDDGDEPDGTDECLCPYDVKSRGGITDDELFEIYSARPAGVRILAISDSCHSGTVARFRPVATPPASTADDAVRRRVRFLPPQAFIEPLQMAKLGSRRAARAASPPGRHAALLMAGCQDTEYSYDAFFRGRANGVFSYVALTALRHLPEDATYVDWLKAIRNVLPSQQYPQSPNLFGSHGMKRWTVLS
jgi:hypothetical protein